MLLKDFLNMFNGLPDNVEVSFAVTVQNNLVESPEIELLLGDNGKVYLSPDSKFIFVTAENFISLKGGDYSQFFTTK